MDALLSVGGILQAKGTLDAHLCFSEVCWGVSPSLCKAGKPLESRRSQRFDSSPILVCYLMMARLPRVKFLTIIGRASLVINAAIDAFWP